MDSRHSTVIKPQRHGALLYSLGMKQANDNDDVQTDIMIAKLLAEYRAYSERRQDIKDATTRSLREFTASLKDKFYSLAIERINRADN